MLQEAGVKKILKRRKELVESRVAFSKQSEEAISKIYRNIDIIIYDIDIELDKFVNNSNIGKWLLQIKGMSVDIVAGILAYFSVDEIDCAAQFISFVGLYDNNKPHNKTAREFINMAVSNFISLKDESYYYKIMCKSFNEINERAINYISKIFVAHIFEKMYLEAHHHPPEKDGRDGNYVVEPEIPYTR